LVTLLTGLLVAYPAALTCAVNQAKADEAETAKEVKLGQEAVDEILKDKKTKLLTDPALVARIETIGNAIAKVANEKEVPARYGKSHVLKFKYTYRILDDKEINAFCLPGGFIFINKGLIDYAQSDDEIAGVLAHETTHAAHHHIVALMAEQQKQMIGLMGAAILGAAVGKGASGAVAVLATGQWLTLAKNCAYGQKAELDADHTGVVYLSYTKYNPVGMLTFMERLARDEERKPGFSSHPEVTNLYVDHPPSDVRARAIIDEIQGMGLPINRRLITAYASVVVKPIDKSQAYSLCISDTEIIRLADSDGKTAAVRASRVASDLRDVLLSGAMYQDVKVSPDGGSVTIMRESVITPTKEDAALAGISVPEISRTAAAHIRQALMNELINQSY
jgi:Zn-dependent protease with chaperone function